MSSWLKSVYKSVLNTGLKLAEIIINFSISKKLKRWLMIQYWIKMKKWTKFKKSINGLKDNFKPYKFTSSFNSNYVDYRSDGDEDKNLSTK